MWAILTAAAAADYRLFCVMFIINFSNKCRGQLRFPWHQRKSATDQTLVVVHFTLPCVNYFCFTGNLEINWLLISLNKINVFNSTALCCCSKSFIFDNVTLCDTCCNEGITKIHVHLLKKHFLKMFCCWEFFCAVVRFCYVKFNTIYGRWRAWRKQSHIATSFPVSLRHVNSDDSICLTKWSNHQILHARTRVLSILSQRSCEICPASLCQQSLSQGDNSSGSFLN